MKGLCITNNRNFIMGDKADTRVDLRRIITTLKEYLISQQDAGLEWLEIPKKSYGALILRELHFSVKDCKKCRLSSSRTELVFGEGDPQAQLLFIGEAPGEEEDSTGRPFIGKAGELLTKIIKAINLSREQVYITSVVKCHPPQNRNPEPDEIASCEPILCLQIKAISPGIICTLGGIATRTLLKTNEPITKIRGTFHDYHGIPVMPTFHPAYLLRNPQAKRQVWEDMQKIQALYQQLKQS